MKLETRMELIVILVAAVVVGGWIGLRMAGKSPTPEGNASSGTEGQAPQQPPAVATPPSPPQKTITVEPPVPTAPKIPTVEEKSPAPNADLQKVAALLKEGKRYEARAILTPLILKTPEGAIREQMRAMLE